MRELSCQEGEDFAPWPIPNSEYPIPSFRSQATEGLLERIVRNMNTKIFLSALVFSSYFLAGGFLHAVETETTAERPRLQPKEIRSDSDFDGKVDRTEIYDEEGKVKAVEVDSDSDGKIDEWLEFKNGVRTKGKRDMDGDGKADVFLRYDKDGELVQLESDTSGNGKIDEWVFYENGEPKSAEKDTNGDGKPDTWIEY